MNISDILNSRSSEIFDLFYQIDKTIENMHKTAELTNQAITCSTFLDNKDVCKLLQVSPRTLQDYRDKRLIPFYKIEGKILYKMSDLHKMLENHYYDSWKQKR